ncbi:endodeoxyribonuclease [Conoideocrella luteorostrata]|uniref:Endodeoxyribonuclease n=1 Tax=Conoideocrella luteorostrata TaxID=1105319 RepID=A0AAJ0FSN3_9HYPO|nr:endodeoxyribonuclease [Conoideocrella luteorostrata]
MASDSQDAIGGQGAGLTERGVGPGMAISRIESLLESVIDSLISAEPMTIEIMSRRRLRSRRSQTSSRQVQFPGRNIFYQHQSLFESQRTVDELVDDIAITLDLDRADLNIVSTMRSLSSRS